MSYEGEVKFLDRCGGEEWIGLLLKIFEVHDISSSLISHTWIIDECKLKKKKKIVDTSMTQHMTWPYSK